MNRVIDRRQAICSVVWIIVIGIVLSLWPLRLVKETVVSDSRAQMVRESEAITTDYVVKQMFIAQYDRLKDIDIYFAGGTPGEEFNFVLYDASMNIIMQQIISTADMKEMPGYCTVQVNIDAEVGREYYYLLQGISGGDDFYVAYENTEEAGNRYIGTLYYGNVEDTEHNMIARYDYAVPLRKGKTLLCDVLLLAFGAAVTWLSGKYYKKYPGKNTLVTVEKVFKTVANPVIAAAGVGAMAAAGPLDMFTFNGDKVSILFYEGSILIAMLLLFYGVNHDRTGIATDRSIFQFLQDRWQNYVQAAMFAGAIWACCNYMNGLYELHHTVAYRQMLIFLALAVIVTYTKKEIFTLYNLVYGVLAAVAGYLYYRHAVEELNLRDAYMPEEEALLAAKLTAWVGVLAGFIIINTVLVLVRGRIAGISVWYGVLVAVFFALIIIYRNTRGWPIYLVCAFMLFYLRIGAWDKRAYLLQNISNGILFHFAVMAGYCLLHRPYMYFQYYRYPFIFHTVTISAVYLALVVCAALVKFLDAYRRCGRLAGVYKELVLLGVSSSYLLFTLSRTGYLAIAVTAAVVIPVCCFSLQRRWMSMLKGIGMMALAVMLCFPVTFTAQRIVPSVTAEPFRHEIEELPVEIAHGRVTDSRYYITIQRFIQVFQMKVLGLPEEKCLDAFGFFASAEEKKTDGRILENDLFVDEGEILLASAEDVEAFALIGASEQSGAEDDDSYTNGRLAIFQAYIDRLNKNGHEDMGIMEPDGNFIVHAHNIYLQVAYDHGIYVGIVFLILGVGTFVQAAVYYHKRKADRVCAALPMALIFLFAVAGLTEWIFHPCCPIACCLLATLAPLIFDMRQV